MFNIDKACEQYKANEVLISQSFAGTVNSLFLAIDKAEDFVLFLLVFISDFM